jgi:glycosyltransferase involved in cell wall biosynthesis
MAESSPLRIAYLTAGAAGMYCGSCMHDNSLARSLSQLGADVQLVPLYTPIQTDEPDASLDRVFFGGINVYLQQRIGLFRYLPSFLDRLLDHPTLLRWIGSNGVETSAANLGELTLSMLRGPTGFQRKEVKRLTQWLVRPPHPEILVLTNILIAGCVPDLKRRLQVPIVVTLQGDDLFLRELAPDYRQRALELIRRLANHVDAFFVHSQSYGDFIANYLGLDRAKFHQIPLGIDTADFEHLVRPPSDPDSTAPLRLGYLARLAPEKGLHVLVDAFIRLRQRPDLPRVELVIAGWQGQRHEPYVQEQLRKLAAEGLSADVHLLGTVDRAAKLRMLSQLHLFSVPATFHEPKGLYALEAMAAGIPIVQPAHGIFPELIAATQGGLLVPPHDPEALAAACAQLLLDPRGREQMAETGRLAVLQNHTARVAAKQTLAVLQSLARPETTP